MPDLNSLIETIRNSRKTLFILCGFPYAGKSYVARELEKHTDIVLVSIDAIFHDHGFDWNTNNVPDTEAWQHIFHESYEVSKSLLRNDKNVLFDSTNQTIASRDALREVAQSVGAETKVLFIDASVGTVWKRCDETKEQKARPVISRDLVQRTIETFELPTIAEHLITISND